MPLRLNPPLRDWRKNRFPHPKAAVNMPAVASDSSGRHVYSDTMKTDHAPLGAAFLCRPPRGLEILGCNGYKHLAPSGAFHLEHVPAARQT